MKNKLKKLLLMISATVALGSIPTCLMAQSVNSITKSVLVEKVGYQFAVAEAPSLKIHLKDPIKYEGASKVLYVHLENAKWLDSIKTVNTSKYFVATTFKKIDDTTLEVKINNSIASGVYYIPLLVELTGGEAKVSLDGGQSEITSMPFTPFAVTSDQKAMVSVGEVPDIRKEDTVASIKINEVIKGALVESSRAEDRVITLTLQNPNYTFENAKPLVVGSKGFSEISTYIEEEDRQATGLKQLVNVYYGTSGGKEDKSILRIYLPQVKDVTSQGRLNISDLKVKTSKLEEGKIDIKVSGPHIQENIVTVAQVKDYGITVIPSSDKPVQIANGNKQNVSFTIQDQVLESMMEKRTISVTLNKGYLSPKKKAGITDISVGEVKLNGKDMTKQIMLTPIYEKDYIVGFNFDTPKLDSTKRNKIQFEDLSIYAPSNEVGDIYLSVESVGLKEVAKAQIGTIKTATTIEGEPIRLKVGVKDQVGGKLVITETDKSMLKEGVLELEMEQDPGISYGEKPQVKVLSGDIKIGDVRYDGITPNKLKIFITRESNKASVIEVSKFVVTVDGTVPDGNYSLEVKGTAISPDVDFGKIEYPSFMVVGESGQNPIPTPGKVILSKFTIGSEVYTVNGVSKIMDVKAYIEDEKTMVPIRYIAGAVGISDQDIQFDKGLITIKASGKVIKLQVGSNMLEVDGERQSMVGRPVIKNERAYVPVAEIAKLLDLEVVWEASTKTAIFQNK